MMKLYGSLASPYVARVVLVARFKKLDLPLEMPADGLKSPAYLARNPFGKMPTLEHDGRCVIESQVICDYLEDLYPNPTILPGDALNRAAARTVTRVAELYAYPEGRALFQQMNPATRDAAAVESGKASLAGALGKLDGLMPGGPWAAGEFSIADCALLPVVVLMQKTIVAALGVADPVGLPAMSRWWAQVMADPMTAGFVAEYGAAVDAFLARMRGG